MDRYLIQFNYLFFETRCRYLFQSHILNEVASRPTANG